MRVVHVVDRLRAIGGVRTYMEALLPALAERGVENVVLTADEGLTEFAGAEVVALPGIEADGPALDAETRRLLRGALAAASPDAVYVQMAPSPEVAAEAAAAAPNVLVYAHDYGMVCPGNARYLHASEAFCADGPGLHCFWRAYTERVTNRRPDRVLTAYRRAKAWERLLPTLPSILVASPFVARQLTAAGARSGSVKVVPYPIEPVARAERRTDPENDVLFVGRLIAAKGAGVLLRALAELPGTSLAIAGDGPDRPALEELAGRLGVADRVRFTGWVDPDARRELFAASRALAFPSLWQEPFGLVGPEALAAGLPVVASDVGGIPSWLTDGEGGLLVPPGDAGRLAAALGRILGDAELYEEMSRRGPEVAARFSVDRHLELLLPELGA